MTSLPDINQKQNVTESAYRRNSLTSSNSEDSLSDKRSSGRLVAGGEGRDKLIFSPSGGSLLTPSPPPGHPNLLNRPKTSLGIRRRPVDYIYMSRSELDKREQALASLRSEVIHLHSQIRELQHYRQDYSVLQGICEGVGKEVGAAVQGCEASTMQDVLLARIQAVLQEHQNIAQQHESCLSELEQCQGELAASKMQLSLAETDLKKTKGQNEQMESELSQAKSELETLQLTCARTGASLSSLRHQLSLAKEKAGKESQETSSEVTHLHTDIGILKRKLAEKEDEMKSAELSLSAMREDQEGLTGRLSDAEAMYMDLGLQLAQILHIETEDSFDPEELLKQIRVITEERDEMQLKCTRLESTVKTADLDTQASRETILRLVSENKKHSKEGEELVRVQEQLEEQRGLLMATRKEREELQQRLVASRETIVAMERELHGKDKKASELARALDSYKEASTSIKSKTGQIESKYEELVKALGAALSVDCSQPEVLVETARRLVQTCSDLSDQLKEQVSGLEEREKDVELTRSTSLQLSEELETEKEKVERLEGELEASEVVKEGLKRDLERSRAFCKKVGRAVGMEQETETILAAGDFAHDAILMKAEQLVKQESESLINKQTALYSLQRKLKACRQSLESKTLQLGLAQRKLEGMEERLKGSGLKEAEWEAATTKVRSLERQLERLQSKVTEQRDTISQLKMESNQLHRMKDYCHKLEEEQGSLVAKKEHLEQSLSRQSQQLSEVRQKVKQRQSVSCKEEEELKTQLSTAQEAKQRLQEVEVKLSTFRSSVHQLLANHDTALAESDRSSVTDFDLMTSLERLLASQEKHRNTAKCLEASLRQLELGFKNNYKDALTLLNSD